MSTGQNITCSVFEFQCTDGTCIFENLKCDGLTDCPDGSDEKDCSEPQSEHSLFNLLNTTEDFCGSNDFACSNGRCIRVKYNHKVTFPRFPKKIRSM